MMWDQKYTSNRDHPDGVSQVLPQSCCHSHRNMRDLWGTEAEGGCRGGEAIPHQNPLQGHWGTKGSIHRCSFHEFHTAERDPDPTEQRAVHKGLPSAQRFIQCTKGSPHPRSTHKYLAKAPCPWKAWSALSSPPGRLAPLCSSELVPSWVEQVLS